MGYNGAYIIMKRVIVLLTILCCFLIPIYSIAQSYDDYYNAGYILGASIRQAVDNNRARKAEEERKEIERLERDRAYRLEKQRIENERLAIQQREAEAKQAEKAIEEERAEKAVLKRREYNNNAQILSATNNVMFFTDEGDIISLSIYQDEVQPCRLFYDNSNNNEIRLFCNNVSIKVKYYGDDNTYSFTDACSITFAPNNHDDLVWSDVFFNISDSQEIENIRIMFVETQIK